MQDFLGGGARYSQQQTDLFLCLRSSFLLRFKLRELRRDERERDHSEEKFVKGHLCQKYMFTYILLLHTHTHLCLDFLEVYLENRPKIIFVILNGVQFVWFFFYFLWLFFSASKRTTCVVCFSWSFSSFSFSSSSAASGCGKETWQENKININSAENAAEETPPRPHPHLSPLQFIYLGKT